jgi:hypothetical protein
MAEREQNTNQSSGRRGNPARNLTHEDRVRGGSRSAQVQVRDALGQFAGKRDQRGGPGRPDDNMGRGRGGGGRE